MFGLFQRRPRVNKILDRREQFDNFSDFLNSLSNDELHEVGKKIVFSKYDGYNHPSCNSQMIYFNNLDRWQKIFYIKERSYCL